MRARAGFSLARASRRLDEAVAAGDTLSARAESEALVTQIEELGALDPSYPARFAAGIVHLRSAEYPAAIDAFSRFLDAARDGPYAMRARNFLKSALEGAEAQGL